MNQPVPQMEVSSTIQLDRIDSSELSKNTSVKFTVSGPRNDAPTHLVVICEHYGPIQLLDVVSVVEFDALTDEQKLEAEQMISTFYNNQRDKYQLQLFGAPPSPVVRRGALPSTLASMQPQHQPMQQMDPYAPMAGGMGQPTFAPYGQSTSVATLRVDQVLAHEDTHLIAYATGHRDGLKVIAHVGSTGTRIFPR